ncbi:META domain-containing protein [Prescottella agglutinans]|uniref:Heat shock protein HslJ n=1 Tax=Prescottella agglutinans TaxID=1644129 RepID=A0ABT6MCP0_9NOCA|nr:META domain-containing protein [Prescottella agglutinans]MDH6282075.1 heat shock protein HslJ [Prescottella agglutinans]
MRTLPAALALLCAATLTACGNTADGADTGSTAETSAAAAPASPADALWGRTFLSISVTGSTIPGGGPLEVAFPEHNHIAMSAGCNRGVSSVDLGGGTVKTGPIATTMMACPGDLAGADKWMTDLFAAQPSWTLTDDVLTLASQNVTVTLADKKTTEPDRPVVGTTWVVESLITPDAVVTSTALETSAPSLTIGQDGQATGSTGCNRFSGPVRVGDSTITFGKLATTRVACPDDVTDVERAVLHVLDGEVTYTVSGPTMELTRPDGTGLHLRGN